MTSTEQLQAAKALVLSYQNELDAAPTAELADTIARWTTDDYLWRGMHPFYEQAGAQAVAESFFAPLRDAFAPLQRRPLVFLAGVNGPGIERGEPGALWVFQMGHHMGLFDKPWLGIPPTRKIVFHRYAVFHRVVGIDTPTPKIAETAHFIDVISVMRQAGHYPLPPQTGASFIYPGPRTGDGILADPSPPEAGVATLDLIERMAEDLSKANDVANETGVNLVSPDVLRKTWHEDMAWYGPEGIGASYTIERYQHQHQFPFRFNLEGKTFNGHVARIAEGDYGCFFGWANLTNVGSGGFLGMTGSGTPADMRVVDVYRREGDKLAENWVFIDLLHWLSMQGLDVLARMRQGLGESFE